MKVGIAGFSGSGKSTVFQWLTGVKPDPAAVYLHPFRTEHAQNPATSGSSRPTRGALSAPGRQGKAGRMAEPRRRQDTALLKATIEVVRKPKGQRGFAVIPRRWVVERSLAWITSYLRLARDYERDPAHSEAMIRWAAINIITRRIARGGPARRAQRRQFQPAT